MADKNDPMPWESNPTLIPVVANLIAALLFVAIAIVAAVEDRSAVWVILPLAMVLFILVRTWPLYRRWRDKDKAPLTR